MSRGLFLSGLLFFLPLPALAQDGVAQPDRRVLVLETVINGRSTGAVGTFTERAGLLEATPEDLHALGFLVPERLSAASAVPLRDLPGLRATIDEGRQQLRVSAEDGALAATEIGVAGHGPGRPLPAPQTTTGLLLNYDLNATRIDGPVLGAGLGELRGFGPWGVASFSALGFAGSRNENHLIRLDAQWSYADPDGLRQLRLGDVVSGGLGWTRPVRLGGGQMARDFGLRPDLVTYPLPSIGGSTAVPSTVDVLVNGVRQLSGSTGGGPFVVRQLPIITGAGEVSVVVRDALGRESVSTLPFYVSGALLAEGLSAYSVEAGAIRRNFGLVSDDYGDLVAMATLRHGVTDSLTLEGHAEGAQGLLTSGFGLVDSLGRFGVASASVALSRASDRAVGRRGGNGWQLGLGYERISRDFSIAGSTTWGSTRYADAAALDGQSFPRRITRASASTTLDQASSLSIAFAATRRSGRARRPATVAERIDDASFNGFGLRDPTDFQDYPQNTRILSATYTRRVFRDMTFYATAFADLAGRDTAGRNGAGRGGMFGLILPLGGRSSAGASMATDAGQSYGTLQASQSAVQPGDLGWRAYASQGGGGAGSGLSRQLGEVEYAGQSGRLLAGLDRAGSHTAQRLGARGALTWAGGGLFASDFVSSAFAVVDTDGVAGVSVLQENRPVGRTNSAGRLLVPGLRAWESNLLSISAEDLPADATIGATSHYLRPRERAGAVAHFAVSRGNSARVLLVDAAGKPLPPGSIVTLDEAGSRFPVGYDGEAFLQGLRAGNALSAQLPDGRRCTLWLAFEPQPETLPLLRPATCR